MRSFITGKTPTDCKMSTGPSKTPSMKSLKESCDQIHLKESQRFIIASSPHLQSLLGGAIVASSCFLTGRPFHITFLDSGVSVDEINTLRENHAKSTVLVIGVKVQGKKKLRKGKGFPLFIGSDFDIINEAIPRVGNTATVTAAAYVLAREKMSVNDDALGLAGFGTVSNKASVTKKRGAHQDLLKLAMKEGVIEERKGFKVFGANSVPLNDAILYSISPYLRGISGNSRRLEQALDDSDVPFSKRRMPITSLTNSEAQKLTSRLIQHIPAEIIPEFLGQDYVLVREEIGSPIRFHSSLAQLGRLAWIRGLHGSLMSVLLGDRARQLRTLLDTQMLHNREVIRGVQRVEDLLGNQTTIADVTEHGKIIDIKGLQSGVITDVGRIILNTDPIKDTSFLIITTESHLVAVWRDLGAFGEVLTDLRKAQITCRFTASNSLEMNDVSETTKQTVAQVLEKRTVRG